MTKGTFGDSLKREREMRGVTIEEIAMATRIASRFLHAIENEQWDQLPGGVFNRGFVRAVARYLGLDEENTVAEYALAVGDSQAIPVWTGSPPAVSSELPRTAWFVIAGVVIALLIGAWFGTRLLLAKRASGTAQQLQAVSIDSMPVAAAAPAPSITTPSGEAIPANASAAEPSASVPSPGTPAPAVENSNAGDPLQLKIEADKKTKVTVIADKDTVFNKSMKAGENQSFSAADSFQVSAKDAGVVHMQLNGKTLAPLGSSGRAGKIILTREALKNAPGGQN